MQRGDFSIVHLTPGWRSPTRVMLLIPILLLVLLIVESFNQPFGGIVNFAACLKNTVHHVFYYLWRHPFRCSCNFIKVNILFEDSLAIQPVNTFPKQCFISFRLSSVLLPSVITPVVILVVIPVL